MDRTRTFLFTAMLLVTALPFIQTGVDAGAPIFSSSYNIFTGNAANNTHIPMDMEVDDSGRIYLLYEGNPRFYYGAYLTYSDDEGLTWSEPVRADDVLRDENESHDMTFMEKTLKPHMDLGPNGEVYIVWTDWRNFNEEEAYHHPIEIRLSKSTDGKDFGRSIMISPVPPYRTQDAYFPDISVNDDGRLFVVWLDEREAGSKLNVWSSYSDDEGETWSTPLMINTDGKFNSDVKIRNVRCAMDGDWVYVTWHDNRDEVYGIKPYIAVSSDGGETFSAEIEFTDDLVEGNIRDMAFPEVDGSGDLYIAWTDQRSDKKEVWFVKSTDHGGNFTPDKRLIDPPLDTQDMNPFINTFGSDRLFVTWEREVEFTNNFGNPAFEKDVYYIDSTDSGQTWQSVMRVDDSDRYRTDRKDQDSVIGAYSQNGRVLCAYGNSPFQGGYTRDLFMARHSKSLTGTADPPEITDVSYFGETGFDERVGNTSTLFTFNMTYWDSDNDMPGDGFPRLQVFRDPQGTDPVFTEPLELDKVRGPSDVYYMDGVPYNITTNIPEEGRFYWQVETEDETGADLVSSEVIEGPIIDMTIPTIEILEPTPRIWNSSAEVRCRIRVTDTGGAGVNTRNITYIRSVQGDEKYDKGVKMTSLKVIDNNTIEAAATLTMYPGKNNYLKFSAYDRVGNGPFITDPVNLWLDPVAPYFENLSPRETEVMIYPDVNCSITIRDNNEGTTNVEFTGVDPESIRYAVKTTSDDFTDWKVPDGYQEQDNGTYRVWVTETFPDEGVHSQIRWKASDRIGNVIESRGFRVQVDVPDNYRPVFKGRAWPDVVVSPTPHFYWEDAFDEDGDVLYYTATILKNNLLWINPVSLKTNTFYDLPDPNALDPGHYVLLINVTDRIAGYDIHSHPFQIKDIGTPPPSMVPEFGPYYTTDSNMSITWEASDQAGTEYRIRIGSKHLGGDILDWTEPSSELSYDLSGLDIGKGAYSIQVISLNNGNYSRVRTGLFKVNDYNVRVDIPMEKMAYRGKEFRQTGPIEGDIINLASLGDNVTLIIEGEPVEAGWVYFDSTGTETASFSVASSKGLTQEIKEGFEIVVAPEEKTPKRDYLFTLKAVSEDGTTEYMVTDITIDVKDAPKEDDIPPLAEDITSVLPFLEIFPPAFIIPAFIVLVLIIIAAIVLAGIINFKIFSAIRSRGDPLKERIKTYKDLYGQDPTPEEIEGWKKELAGSTETVSSEIEETSVEEEDLEEGQLPPDGEAPETQEGPPEGPKEDNFPEEEEDSSLDSEDQDLLDRLFD